MSNIEHSVDDEISLKELILKIQDFIREVWNNKWWVVVLSISFVVFSVVKEKLTFEKSYEAKYSFFLNENKSAGLSGVSSVLGTLGLGRGKQANFEKVISIAKSRNVISKTIFQKLDIEGKSDYIANHLIDAFKLHEKWENIEEGTPYVGLKGFYFKNDNYASFDVLENKALLSLITRLVGSEKTKGIYAVDVSDTGEFNMSIQTGVEKISITFLNLIYEELTTYYYDEQVGKQKQSLKILDNKQDSLFGLLKSKSYQIAQLEDRRGITRLKDKYQAGILYGEIEVLKSALGQIAQNREITDFSIKDTAPYFTQKDAPIAPLSPTKPSYVKKAILGGILGAFLGIFFFVSRKLMRDIMASE